MLAVLALSVSEMIKAVRQYKKEKQVYDEHKPVLFCASLMDEALLLLLERKEFDSITVKEICLKAGVNRSTFYLHIYPRKSGF